MSPQRIITITLITILFLLSTSITALPDKCKEDRDKLIDKYIGTCRPSDNIQDIGFAPHQRKQNSGPGELAYELIEESYPYNTFPIDDIKYKNKIWFYSNIKKDANNKMPKYIWHLIISPAPKAAQKDDAEGFLVNIDFSNTDLDMLTLLEEEDEEEYLAKSFVEGSNPVIYTNNEINDIYDAKILNEIWKKLVKNKNFNLISCERTRQDTTTPYDYTFYFHKISAGPNNVNLNFGYRIPSMKTITSSGNVYGFVLNEDGLCLGYKQITAK
jgi:hypothetical protein